ncbi:hypothetical protein DRQ21_05325 [Candidatus Fermentibacteria bacterium]|nr:MAG: hypothetical protein DRQ21_05325 [Candidatus Fermentibacteria bacterium]
MERMEEHILLSGKHYCIPYKDSKIYYFPESLSIIKCDHATSEMIEILNMPMSESGIVRRMLEEYSVSKKDCKSAIQALVESGILYRDGKLEKSVLERKDPLQEVESLPEAESLYPPKLVTIHITDKCNLKCVYCMNYEARAASTAVELSISDWSGILKDLFQNGVKEVCFSGGEPFLRPDMITIIKKALQIGLKVAVITNGTVDISDVEALRDVNITVSLDSAQSEENNRNRGSGAFEKTTRFLDRLNEARKYFSINSVLTKHNIEGFFGSAKILSDRYRFLRVIRPIPQETSYAEDRSLYSFAQWELFLEDMLTNTISNNTDKYIDYSEVGTISVINGCGVARNECMIGPDGAIYPCRALQKDVFKGTVLNGSNFSEVWKDDPVLKRLRSADRRRANDCVAGGCDFWYFCAGGCFGKTYDLCCDLRSFASTEECSKLKARTYRKIIHKLYMQEKADREGNNEK